MHGGRTGDGSDGVTVVLVLALVLGMIAAAFGYLTPVQGALLQEAIDVAVILNALRALSIAPRAPVPLHSQEVASRQSDGTQEARA